MSRHQHVVLPMHRQGSAASGIARRKVTEGKAKTPSSLSAHVGRIPPMLCVYWPRGTPSSIIEGTWKLPVAKLSNFEIAHCV